MRVLLLGACASLLAAAAVAQPYDQDQQTYRGSDQGYGDQQQSPGANDSSAPDQNDQSDQPDQTYRSDQTYRGDRNDQSDQNPGGPYGGDRYRNGQGDYGDDQYRSDDQYRGDQGDRNNNDTGQYGDSQYDDDSYGEGQHRGYSSDDGYRSESYRMGGARYTGRVGDQSWRDDQGRTCIYRQLTWTAENGQPAYKWVPSCHD